MFFDRSRAFGLEKDDSVARTFWGSAEVRHRLGLTHMVVPVVEETIR